MQIVSGNYYDSTWLCSLDGLGFPFTGKQKEKTESNDDAVVKVISGGSLTVAQVIVVELERLNYSRFEVGN